MKKWKKNLSSALASDTDNSVVVEAESTSGEKCQQNVLEPVAVTKPPPKSARKYFNMEPDATQQEKETPAVSESLTQLLVRETLKIINSPMKGIDQCTVIPVVKLTKLPQRLFDSETSSALVALRSRSDVSPLKTSPVNTSTLVKTRSDVSPVKTSPAKPSSVEEQVAYVCSASRNNPGVRHRVISGLKEGGLFDEANVVCQQLNDRDVLAYVVKKDLFPITDQVTNVCDVASKSGDAADDVLERLVTTVDVERLY